ncbi:hypothetical protein [Kitasatospora phosalacinea]|uniref:Terpene synthase n=1 Tax=Kitasatospora phosalacinea TaxID=2065 RepID=A0ABW6GVY4_9ACTN
MNTTGTDRAQPEIRLPFPATEPPAVDEEPIVEWAARFDLLRVCTAEEVRRAGYAAAGAWMYPPSRDVLWGQWLTWLWLVDEELDAHFEGRSTAAPEPPQSPREVMPPPGRERAAPCNRFTRALADLWARTAPNSPPDWAERFTADVCEPFDPSLLALEAQRTGPPPDLATYTAHRRAASATRMCLDLVEAVRGCHLPADLAAHDHLQTLRTTAVDVISWTNDLHSLPREEDSGAVTNLVLVLQHHRDLDRPQALDEATAMINRRATELHRLARHTPRLAHDPAERATLDAYAQGVLDWTAGHARWCATTRRYA